MECLRCGKKLNIKYLLNDTEYLGLKSVEFFDYCLRCKKKRKEIDKELTDFYFELYSKLNKLNYLLNLTDYHNK
jgi:hypothetical protein